jgi:hypothetical protein
MYTTCRCCLCLQHNVVTVMLSRGRAATLQEVFQPGSVFADLHVAGEDRVRVRCSLHAGRTVCSHARADHFRYPQTANAFETQKERSPQDIRMCALPTQDVRGTGDPSSTKPWVEAISWHPRAFVYHNFLSAEASLAPLCRSHVSSQARQHCTCHIVQPTIADEPLLPQQVEWHQPLAMVCQQECDHIVNISKPLMMRSTVVSEGGASVVDHIRTSYGTFIRCDMPGLM